MPNIRTTVVSFAIMVALWGVMFNSLTFALGFIILLAIHEMGHYVAARKLGMDVSMPVFTPIGALIQMRELPKNAYDEALMAYAGPFAGTVAAVICLFIGDHYQSPDIVKAAQVGFFLNLFNLIPLAPMDGGRICMAITRHMWILGVPMLGLAFYGFGLHPLNMIILALLAVGAWNDIKLRKHQALNTPEYFQVGATRRIIAIGAYIGLIVFLLYALVNSVQQ